MRARLTAVNLATPGQVINPSDNVTLIVGPNNVGKSAVLAGIQQQMTFEPAQPVAPGFQAVDSISVSVPQAGEYLEDVLGRARLFPPGTYPQGTFYEETYAFPSGVTLSRPYVANALGRSSRFGQFAGVIAAFMGPEGRGGVLMPQAVPDLMNSAGRSPIQMLWESRHLEAQIDGYMQQAFGKPFLVNRFAGANIYLHMGQVDLEEPRIGERTEYLDRVMALPQLSAQGSGMQAFMGTILTLAAGAYDIVLLDEPEAFLHPPQARLLGEVVAGMSRDDGPQVIVATHSDDFVQGVIGASREDAAVSVVRITRPVDTENRVAQVAPEALAELYRDPLLRYSNIMDGIFYKGVVLCEAESDCTYYSATLSFVEESKHLGASDLLFTHCGGKDRLERAYRAVDAASVPTAIIADIDLLADKAKFSSLLEAMGGVFEAIEPSYNTLESSIKAQKIEPNREQSRQLVNEVFDASSAVLLSKAELTKIGEAVRAESGWKQVKRKGIGAVDKGDPTAAFKGIVAACRALGLFLVEVGELERFHQDISGNKQEWLRQVLEGELFQSAKTAQSFVEDVRTFIAGRQ